MRAAFRPAADFDPRATVRELRVAGIEGTTKSQSNEYVNDDARLMDSFRGGPVRSDESQELDRVAYQASRRKTERDS